MTDKDLIIIAITFVSVFLLYDMFGMIGVVAAGAVMVVSALVDDPDAI